MNKKIILGIIVIVVLVTGFYSLKQTSKDMFTIGAVLPMTGAASLWGETVKNGMDLALEGKTGLQVMYEDSRSAAADGVTAYNLLKSKGVDVFFSELSLVAVPLSKLALENKTQLLVSLVAAEHSSIVNDYTTRYYTDPTNYATPAFTSQISPVLNAKKIAILTRNDDLGNSVKAKITELAAANGKQIVSAESFMPAEKDFNTVILKAKNSGADVFIFVASTPGEAVGIVKTAKQLGLSIPIVESSAVFADLDTRKQAEGISFYSTSYDFSLLDKAVDFKTKYKAKYGKEPNFGAAFGYDMVNLIDQCKDKQATIRKCLEGIDKMEGAAGVATQVLPGDFTVQMHLEKVN